MVNVSKFFSMINRVEVAKVGKTASNMAEQAVQKIERGAVADDIYKTVVNSDGSMSKLFSNGNRLTIRTEVLGSEYGARRIVNRQFYNKDGIKVLSDRKWVDTEQVGNKTVRTKGVNREVTCLNSKTGLDKAPRGDDYRICNYRADRVYQDGKLVGVRETETELSHKSDTGFYKTAVTKCAADSSGKVKSSIRRTSNHTEFGIYYDDNIIRSKSIPDENYHLGAYKPAFNMGLG